MSMYKDIEGKMIVNKERVLRRWRDHFDELLNQEIGTNTAYDLEAVPMAQQDEVPDPSLEEVKEAIKKQRSNKSPATDNIV
jgi:DNA primase large subunit